MLKFLLAPPASARWYGRGRVIPVASLDVHCGRPSTVGDCAWLVRRRSKLEGQAMQTFCGAAATALEDVRAGQVVVLSAAHCTPYEPGKPSHSADAPDAIRSASAKFAMWHDHYDFDTDSALLPDGVGLVDAGAIATKADTPEANRSAISAAAGVVLAAGAQPIIFGGDDSMPIPVFEAYRDHGPLWIVQVDAHIDWRDERFGEPLGWSSTMRRASEMAWVAGIVQVGIRGVGSARTEDVAFAKDWGARIITAREVHANGVAPALKHVPDDARVFVTFDCDALDPAIMPGVMAQSPGGLTYWQVMDLFADLKQRCKVVGFNLVELAPQRDVGGVSALTSARIACLAANAMWP
jgi:agmatinase